MTNLFVDVETLPTADPAVLTEIASSVTPPGNYKKAETIAEWEATTKPALVLEKLAETALNPLHGELLTIAFAFDDGPVFVLCRTTRAYPEAKLLTEFFGRIEPHLAKGVKWIAHNAPFDLGFLRNRAIVCAVSAGVCVPADPAPWDDAVFDTMTAWAGRRGRVGLKKLARALSIPVYDDTTGADVARLFAEGRIIDIEGHCVSDVQTTRAVWRRLMFEATP